MAVTANELKDQGNRCFAMRKYPDAVACYSKAIVGIFSVLYILSPTL